MTNVVENLGPGLRQVKQGGGGFFLLYVIIYSKTHVSKPLNYHRTSVVGLIVVKSLVLCLVVYKSLFVFLFFSCDRCIDCPSSICSF